MDWPSSLSLAEADVYLAGGKFSPIPSLEEMDCRALSRVTGLLIVNQHPHKAEAQPQISAAFNALSIRIGANGIYPEILGDQH
jgi:hypothetical protein